MTETQGHLEGHPMQTGVREVSWGQIYNLGPRVNHKSWWGEDSLGGMEGNQPFSKKEQLCRRKLCKKARMWKVPELKVLRMAREYRMQ